MTDIGHILVVENEKSMRDLLTIVLEKDGYEVNTARNGQVAVEMIEGTDYDVVLTDINMPRANGIAVLDAVNRMSTTFHYKSVAGDGPGSDVPAGLPNSKLRPTDL